MSAHLKITICFQFHSPFHITGEQTQLWIDRVLVLDWNEYKNPIIPATTIKGWLRERAESILRSIGLSVCDGSTSSTICGTCLICKVFGHPHKKSCLRFYDAKLSQCFRDIRMNASLSRYRKNSYEEHLFSIDLGWQKQWECKVHGFFDTQNEAIEAVALLWIGSTMSFAIGGARSRGLGWLKVKKFQAKIDGENISQNMIFQKIEEIAMSSKGV